MFGRKASEAKTEHLDQAAEADREAAEHRAAIAKYRKGSDDPAADRYMIQQHEEDLRGAVLDARNHRDAAKWL